MRGFFVSTQKGKSMPMDTKKLELSSSCRFETTTYEGINVTDVTLEYVEHSTDHWNSDSTTSISIGPDMARKIIEFLREAHGLDDEKALVAAGRDRITRSGNDLALMAERHMDAVDDCAMKRSLLAGLNPNSDHRPLAWDQLQQAEKVETDLRRALQRAVHYWRKCGA